MTKSGAKLKKLKVCWSIDGQNAQIQNQRPKWKKRPTSCLASKFDRDTIELILKSQLRTGLNKLKI